MHEILIKYSDRIKSPDFYSQAIGKHNHNKQLCRASIDCNMKDRYRISGYDITSDPQFWIDQYNITPELEREMPRLEAKAVEGNISAIGDFQEQIKKHPENPQLKNLLSALYVNSGQQAKAEEVNRRIETEHPDYLFAKLNRAAVYYQNEEYEKMPQVLGEMMELQELYPERSIFFISEFLSYYKLAALYFAAIGDIDQAQMRLKAMEKVAPEHPDIEYIKNVIFYSVARKAASRMETESRIAPEVMGRSLPTQRTEAPQLTNAMSAMFLTRGWDFTKEEIQELLGLPRQSFIDDLKLLLEDAHYRFHYFHDQFEENEIDDRINFPIHALLFMGELNAEECLSTILEFLRYKLEFNEIWLGDTLTEIVWQVIYKVGEKQTEKLRDFLLEPNLDTYSKSAVSTALSQIALHQPERRTEIIDSYRMVLDAFICARPGDDLLDSELTGFIVGDLLDINASELEPEMKKLYDLGYVIEGICGPWEEVEESLKAEETFFYDVLSLQDQYKWLQDLSHSWDREPESFFPEDEDESFLSGLMDQEYAPAKSIVKDKKVGRNEPCPCGSGKKFKKCCG